MRTGLVKLRGDIFTNYTWCPSRLKLTFCLATFPHHKKTSYPFRVHPAWHSPTESTQCRVLLGRLSGLCFEWAWCGRVHCWNLSYTFVFFRSRNVHTSFTYSEDVHKYAHPYVYKLPQHIYTHTTHIQTQNAYTNTHHIYTYTTHTHNTYAHTQTHIHIQWKRKIYQSSESQVNTICAKCAWWCIIQFLHITESSLLHFTEAIFFPLYVLWNFMGR